MKRPTQKTLLSLFDGTGSICGPFLRAGWNVRRLDIDGLRGADIVVDIRNWDPAVHWSGPAPDVIFAGPPCENYSSARTRAKSPRDLKLADSLVRKTIDVIEYFHTMNPTMQFFVENPDSSMLWRRWVSHRLYKDVANHPLSVFVETMNISRERKSWQRISQVRSRGFKESCKDRHVVRLDYCQYGTKYRKRTRLMTNNPFGGLMCKKNCGNIVGGRHIEVAQRGPREFSDTDTACPGRRMHTLSELHAYPADLVEAIFKHVDGAVHCERRGVGPKRAEPSLFPLAETDVTPP
ncbi:hypothetical protein D5F01_LYC24144 [Larimichthys crocea]|uniref:Uncharacterized protein n=1 Tax=Larimichthys crocea TaxID=215358 RepID=A0A6G0HFE4_LARCR|nr:hypothetical protein D5F01_LYC24231 [Larimichthys crocea]KAE8277817.1 hypothetical protein D5F01_LYC24144 [Larimichthys crocea]